MTIGENFNPRSREGSDRLAIPYRHALYSFQSTLPRRERPRRTRFPKTAQYFNPRSREGSDVGKRLHSLFKFGISIHAPAKGATSINPRIESTMPNFNPRSREGSDVFNLFLCQHGFISIHAPAKGATRAIRSMSNHNNTFQSTLPRRERRDCSCIGKRSTATFQSTLPRRERLNRHRIRFRLVLISIHAPAKGAT